jgi:hypothetical protein
MLNRGFGLDIVGGGMWCGGIGEVGCFVACRKFTVGLPRLVTKVGMHGSPQLDMSRHRYITTPTLFFL